MRVWISKKELKQTYPKFHRTPDCKALNRLASRWGKPHVIEMDLDDIPGPDPCRDCYPDYNPPRFARPYCDHCDTNRPCPHNGAVQVEIITTLWVWPDMVGGRRVVDWGLHPLPEDG